MIDNNKLEQYGIEREEGGILGITIHEFDDSTKTAQDVLQYLNEESRSNEAYHFVVDANDVIQLMPLDYAVYHTGKMMDWGDEHTVAIAICNNDDETEFMAGVQNAIDLINDLIDEYSLSYRDIFFHIDFNSKVHCPFHLLDMYGSSAYFAYNTIGLTDNQ